LSSRTGIFSSALQKSRQYHFNWPALRSNSGISSIRHGPADTVQFGIAPGQVLQPEVVVVMQVEQRAVHVQQNGIDVAPR
jgi:hypothetical protein